jgi:predicted nucleic acid-binding protein
LLWPGTPGPLDGADRHERPDRRLRLLSAVLAEAPVVDVDRTVSARYGELRAASGRRPTNDLWIAATALAHDFTLITGDERQAALPLARVTLIPHGA